MIELSTVEALLFLLWVIGIVFVVLKTNEANVQARVAGELTKLHDRRYMGPLEQGYAAAPPLFQATLSGLQDAIERLEKAIDSPVLRATGDVLDDIENPGKPENE